MAQKMCKTFYHVVPKSDETELEFLEIDDVDAIEPSLDYTEFGKVYLFGDKETGFKRAEPLQDFEKLRQEHIRNCSLFEDETFSPETIALPQFREEVVWKRPFEISDNPEFIVDGASRFDIDQGELSDCWFLAAVANLTINEKLLSMVIPSDQDFTTDYVGIFHFRFWQYGRWVDVVIDDRLPTIDNELVYLRSADPNEYWPCLLEKAYAKFYGSYKSLEAGQISTALEDLCGGLSECYCTSDPEIFRIMFMSYKRSSFMGCFINGSEPEGRRSDGLVECHAYSITDMRTVREDDSYKRLIRVRNPWGDDVEWNGKWSDNCDCWSLVPRETREKLLVQKADGEFWMEFDDFRKCFTFVDICHLNPSSFFSSEDWKDWNVCMFEGSWVSRISAGGGFEVNKDSTFAINPQYFFSIRGDNPNDEYAVVIGLMQKNRRRCGETELALELDIFRVPMGQRQLLDKSFFQSHNPVVHRIINGFRQLTLRVMLPRGRYCIIPSTYYPNEDASYLMRIYSEVRANVTTPTDPLLISP